MGFLVIILVTCLCLYAIKKAIGFLNKVWWTPIRIESEMKAQGVKGPPYKFLRGNIREIMSMRKSAMGKPMELSHQMLPRLQPHVYTWSKIYGNNHIYWLGPRPQLQIGDPEMVKEILNNNEGFPKSVVHNFIEKLLGDGLVVVTKAKKWAKMRKLYNHAFHSDSLKAMYPAMISSIEAMIKRWKYCVGKELEAYEEMRVMTSEIISRTAFGSSYEEGQKIFDMLTKLSLIIAQNHFKPGIPFVRKFFKSNEDKESDRYQQGIRDAIISLMSEREKEVGIAHPESYGNDFLGVLLKAHHETDKTKKITLDDLIDECRTVYIGGHETCTSSLTWTFLLLAIHTDWQDKAREEVLEFFGKQTPNPDAVGRLKTINMIVNESLRLYPPVFHVTRTASKEMKLGNLAIPSNVPVSLPILALHRNPQIWGEDADLFKPERFAEGVAKATKSNPAAFLPFGLGPRSCAGLNFATIEIRIALCMVLQNYKFTLSPRYVHAPVHMLTIRPEHGVPIILHEI